MEIEINKKPTRDFYDELLYITTNYKKYLDNRNKLAKQTTSAVTKYLIFTIIGVIFSLSSYLIFDKDNFFLLTGAIFAICMILSIIYLRIIKNNMNLLLTNSEKNKSTLIIDDKNVSLKKDSSTTKISWNTIDSILINKYSIIFLPGEIINPYIAIPSTYKKEVITALKKYKKIELLIDNSELYK